MIKKLHEFGRYSPFFSGTDGRTVLKCIAAQQADISICILREVDGQIDTVRLTAPGHRNSAIRRDMVRICAVQITNKCGPDQDGMGIAASGIDADTCHALDEPGGYVSPKMVIQRGQTVVFPGEEGLPQGRRAAIHPVSVGGIIGAGDDMPGQVAVSKAIQHVEQHHDGRPQHGLKEAVCRPDGDHVDQPTGNDQYFTVFSEVRIFRIFVLIYNCNRAF